MWLNTIKTNNPIKQWAEDVNRHFSKEDIQIAKRHMKQCSTSLIIREISNQNYNEIWPHTVRTAIIKNSTNSKGWKGCGEKGTLLHCWWECKLVEPLWKTVYRFLKKRKREAPYDPAIPLPGTHLEKSIQKGPCTPVFIAALFKTAKTWKQPKCPLTEEWIKKVQHIYAVEYY